MSSGSVGKVRENRLRRAAERQGLVLTRSRRRDPLAIGYGKYSLHRGGNLVTPIDGYDLDQIEDFLMRDSRK